MDLITWPAVLVISAVITVLSIIVLASDKWKE